MTTNADAPESSAAPDWAPVPDAAALAEVPPRSLYRWIERKKLPTKAEGTATLVQVSAVRAIAARRAAAKNAGASAVSVGTASSIRADNEVTPHRGMAVAQVGGTAPSNRTRPDEPASEGELTAEVFSRLEEGAGPVDVVREMRLPPDCVRAIHREWMELKALAGAGPSIAERIAAMEERIAQFAGPLGEQVFGLECNLNNALARLEAMERKLASLPIPSASDFTCPLCRTSGRVAALVACGACRTPMTFETGR